MTSDELMDRLGDGRNAEPLPETEEKSERFFVFAMGDGLYALPPASIREIVSGLDIFPLPACPPYISGLINCHGIPHTVFDLRVLFSNERQGSDLFLILNLDNDSVAFACTEVKEIIEVPVSGLSRFAEKDGDALFFSSMIETLPTKVPVLSVPHILRKLETDLE
jgi:chemotaxis signal transduction protein